MMIVENIHVVRNVRNNEKEEEEEEILQSDHNCFIKFFFFGEI